MWSALITGTVTYGICHMQKYGQKIVERIITGMVAVISIAYVWEMVGLALLAPGLSSSTVGTMAGEVILSGFVGFDIPISIRRLIIMIPGLAILIAGVNPMEALVYSQVVLSFALPAAIIPLMVVINKAKIMGRFKNSILTNCMGWVIVSMILAMNAVLMYLTFTGQA